MATADRGQFSVRDDGLDMNCEEDADDDFDIADEEDSDDTMFDMFTGVVSAKDDPQIPSMDASLAPLPNVFGPLGPDDIRLLTIDSTDTFDKMLSLHLHPTPLHQAPPYLALSYYWGPTYENKSHLEELISCDEVPVRVTASLHSALKRIRAAWDRGALLCNGRRPALWVDALCIDQQNLLERSRQVNMMDRVYIRSRAVLVWLGEPFDRVAGDLPVHLEGFQDALASTAHRRSAFVVDGHGAINNEDTKEAVRRGVIENALRRNWFKRRWVIQEIALQPRRWLLLGEGIFEFAQFQSAVTDIGRQNSLVNGASRLQKRPLLLNLALYHGARCADARDIVDSLLSISTDRADYTVDYTKSANAIFLLVAQRHARQETLPTLLACAASLLHAGADEEPSTSKKESPLPSWVPNWSRQSSWSMDWPHRHDDESSIPGYVDFFYYPWRRDGNLLIEEQDTLIFDALLAWPCAHRTTSNSSHCLPCAVTFRLGLEAPDLDRNRLAFLFFEGARVGFILKAVEYRDPEQELGVPFYRVENLFLVANLFLYPSDASSLGSEIRRRCTGECFLPRSQPASNEKGDVGEENEPMGYVQDMEIRRIRLI